MGYDEEHYLLDVAADAVARDERSSIRQRGGPCPSRPKTRTRAPSGSSSATATRSFVWAASRTWSVGKQRRLNWSFPPSSLTDYSWPGAPGASTLSCSSSRLRPTRAPRGRAGTTRLAAGLPRPRRGSQRPRVGASPQGKAPRRRSSPPTQSGRRDRAGRSVTGRRAVDAARRAGPRCV